MQIIDTRNDDIKEQLKILDVLIINKRLEVARPSSLVKRSARPPSMPRILWMSMRADMNRPLTTEEVQREKKRHKADLRDLLDRREELTERLNVKG